MGPTWSIFGALATSKIELPCRRELDFHVLAVLAFNRAFWFYLERLGRCLDSTWAPLGLKLDVLRANLDALGANLVALGADLDALGANLDALGANFDALWANLGALGANFDALGVNLDFLGVNLDAFGANLDAPGVSVERVLVCLEHAWAVALMCCAERCDAVLCCQSD